MPIAYGMQQHDWLKYFEIKINTGVEIELDFVTTTLKQSLCGM